MDSQSAEQGVATIEVRNVGGIDETSVEFRPGVTVLAGRNATNRTSLLRAVMAACGSGEVSVKADAEEAHVALSVEGGTYTRSLTRRNGALVSDGEPYLEDPETADLFAFLLESNEARRAIERGEDLREVIMRPIDTGEIESAIDRLTDEREAIEAELREIDELEDRRVELEEERERLERRIEEKRAELAETEAALDVADDDPDRKETLDVTLEELQSTRAELEDVRYDVETEEESLSAIRTEEADLRDELADLSDSPDEDIAEVEAELERLRDRQGTLDAELDELQRVIQFNRRRLEGAEHAPTRSRSDGGSITDALVDGETVSCWTCGTEVEREQIEATLEGLRELNEAKVRESDELAAEIADRKDELDGLRRTRERRREVERRLETIRREIDERGGRIEELQARRDALEAEVEELESEVESLEEDVYSESLALKTEVSDLEFQLGRLEDERREVEEEIAAIEDRISRREDLEAEREDVRAEIEELRTTVERIEDRAVEAFNEHMTSILDLLGYENIERIWLERLRTEGASTAESTIELHVVRSGTTGAVYEDSVHHLSESEREVTGLVFALAGYLAHEVHEQLPFVLLDSLEAIDAERIAALVEYLSDYCPYLVVALLPEDADELDDSYARVETI